MRKLPIALTIAGSDSGGGAGIQADLKTFRALGVHGTSVIACLTAQNPREVLAASAINPTMVQKQLEAIFKELPPAAVKTGMLFSERIIEIVFDFLSAKRQPLVIDPVMVSTSGALLLKKSAIKALKKLFLRAAIITPNLDETKALLGRDLKGPEDLRQSAHDLHAEFGCAALVKGGHLRGFSEAIDIFYDGKQELLLSAPFVGGVNTHGTGCTYSAAITANLARGRSLPKAVTEAKQFITRAIQNTVQIAGHQALGW
jgi:hydroxymethylpyrimidine/phosphomethylpyrimidine kinase